MRIARRTGHHVHETVPRRELGNEGQRRLARPHPVHLVHDRDGGARAADDPIERKLVVGRPASGLHHEQHDIGIGERRGSGPVHRAVQGATCSVVQSGSVDKRDLRVGQVDEPEYPVARRLGTWRYN